jgi:hypothetical protein
MQKSKLDKYMEILLATTLTVALIGLVVCVIGITISLFK